MAEICYIASAMRLPFVMLVANRALSGPINIWNDHGDLMMARDSGWIQTIAENGQEAIDMVIHAYKVAEDHRVSLPVQVNLDGFTLTHMIEPMEMPEKKDVQEYLPPFTFPLRLDPKKPVSLGVVGMPDVYTEAKKAQDEAMKGSKAVVIEAWKQFGEKFGRYYKPVETYKTEGAETVFLTMGSLSETAMTAIDQMQAAGKKVGLVRIRLFRPFPTEELLAALKGIKTLIVIDRALMLNGLCGPVCAEIKAALFNEQQRPQIRNFIAGLGGRDVTIQNFEEMVEKATSSSPGESVAYEIINVRE
jgi:pyruvate ferredoxin oxidoreductase alpha subunit